MKYLSPLIALLLLMAPQVSFSQSYSKMWKAVEQASENEHPQTANRHLLRIISQARRSGNMPQLIRALCTRQTVMRNLSPDSGKVVIQDLEAELRHEQRPVEKALWQNAVGQSLVATYGGWGYRQRDTAALHRGILLLRSSLENTELLGRTLTKAYAPVFDFEKGSTAIYKDDLLSVLTNSYLNALDQVEQLNWRNAQRNALKQEVLKRNLTYYQSAGHRRAAFHVEMQWAETLPYQQQGEEWERLRQAYLDLPDNAEAYLKCCQRNEREHLDDAVTLAKEGIARYGKSRTPALENWLRSHEVPSLQVEWRHANIPASHFAFYPTATYQARLSYRNIRKAEIRFHRMEGLMGDDPRLKHRYLDQKDLQALLKEVPHRLELSLHHDASPAPKHREVRDSLSFIAPQAGIYIVELLADGRRVSLQLERAYRTLIVDWKFSGDQYRRTQRRFIDLLSGKPLDLLADRAFISPRDLPDNNDQPSFRPVVLHPANPHIFTDRAVYRPGQTVEVSGVYFSASREEREPIVNRTLRIILCDTEGNRVDTLSSRTDAFGTFAASLAIPRYCRTGAFSVLVAYEDKVVTKQELILDRKTIRVEEYKRPTFAVRLDTLPRRVVHGQRVTLAGSVRTYSDLPVADARVILRRQLNPSRWLSDDDDHRAETSHVDTLTTDENGRFAHVFEAGKGWNKKTYLHYQMEAEVLAENGETQSANAYLAVSSEHPKPSVPERPKMEQIATGDPSHLKVVVRDSCYLFSDLATDTDQWLESREIEVTDSTVFDFRWKPEYGDGLTLHLLSVKNGIITEGNYTLKRPDPDKRLLFKWDTFRSQLQPGQTEEWTLTVTHPDGSPAAANIMARLYDASLDAFVKSEWKFRLHFSRFVPSFYTAKFSDGIQSLGYWGRAPWRDVPQLRFTDWKLGMFSERMNIVEMDYHVRETVVCGAAAPEMKMAAPMAMRTKSMSLNDFGEERVQSTADAQPMPNVQLRSDFSETAFFFPRLRTDHRGIATLRFTLPESLTQWNFTAFAHDQKMNYGLFSDTIVARKLLMVEPALPRFLREGDRIELPVTVRNVSGITTLVSLFVDLLDEKTGKVLRTFRQAYTLSDRQHTTATFSYEVPDGLEGLKVRAVAKSDAFSDGEERILPILSRRITLTHSVPFTVKSGESYATKLALAQQRLRASLERGVKVDLQTDTCRDARREVAQIVPQLLDDSQGSAVDYATALYGLELAAALPQYHTMTTEEIEHRRTRAIDRLLFHQTSDGGWSWYPKMRTSPWVTLDVLTLLARIPMLTGKDRYANIREHALKYIDVWMTNRVAELRKLPHPSLGELELRYLYVAQLLQRKPNDTRTYLLDLAAEQPHSLTMLGKSALSLVLADTKHGTVAQKQLQSVVEHTVVSEEMGRYFDTHRALNGWASYRIPTQVYALEALQRLGNRYPQMLETPTQQLIDEMLLWLLQSKRTQVWNTSRATADATFALLHAPTANDSLTWGAVSATYSLPSFQALEKGNGFSLLRRLEVKRGEQWVPLSSSAQGDAAEGLQVGDAVRWVYTLTAERDFDHVALRSARPAAFETLRPLSGTQWWDGLHAYRMSRDTENEYFIEHLRKGTHTFTEEMRVVRAGHYDAGLATVRSVYAPEFSANSTALRFLIHLR